MVRKENMSFSDLVFFRTNHKFLVVKPGGMGVYNTWISVFDLNKGEGRLLGRGVV